MTEFNFIGLVRLNFWINLGYFKKLLLKIMFSKVEYLKVVVGFNVVELVRFK